MKSFIDELIDALNAACDEDTADRSTPETAIEPEQAPVPETEDKAVEPPQEQEAPVTVEKKRLIDDPKNLIIFSEIMKPKF